MSIEHGVKLIGDSLLIVQLYTVSQSVFFNSCHIDNSVTTVQQ